MAQTVWYTTYSQDSDITDLFGQSTVDVWADLDNSEDAGLMADRMAEARYDAFHELNGNLRGSHYRIPIVSATVRHNGTALGDGTGNNQIELGATASTLDSFYDHSRLSITLGTGVGQTRTVTAYVGSTRVATVERDWGTNPDSTSVYKIEGVPPVIRALEAKMTGIALQSARGHEDQGPLMERWRAEVAADFAAILAGGKRLDAI